jgi:hypothetical protein
MKLTRRELAGVFAVVASPRGPGEAPETAEQMYKSAVEDSGKNSTELRKFKIPIEAEPAFAFKAQ